MVADPEEGLVTDLMLGMMVAFGFDIILLLGVIWIAGLISFVPFFGATVLIIACYAIWIGYRWWALRTAETLETDPVEELKRSYARGELTEDELEAKLGTILDDPNTGDAIDRGVITEQEDGEKSVEESRQ